MKEKETFFFLREKYPSIHHTLVAIKRKRKREGERESACLCRYRYRYVYRYMTSICNCLRLVYAISYSVQDRAIFTRISLL